MGLTQEEVATIFGFKGVGRISCWEQGVSTPGLVNCIKLAALYSTWVDGLYIDLVREIRKDVQTRFQKWLDDKDKQKRIAHSRRIYGEK